MKKIYSLIIILICSVNLFGQKDLIIETGDIISKSTQLDGENSYEFTANSYVEFLNGFGYLPTPSNYLVAKTSPLIVEIPQTGITGGSLNNLEGGRVGTSEGGFTVTPTGAAVYSVPIKAPPGTSGMTPEIALVYNSQFDDGLLGEKWTLSGLSAITLAAKTYYFDDAAEAVELPQSLGPFLLDGMRLLEVGQTSNTTEYRTEIDKSSKIIGIRSPYPSAVFKFIVYTKSGLMFEYGFTENSKHYLKDNSNGNKCTIAWYVNKISDKYNNYIEFEYYQDEINGELMIKEIRYTGNSSTELAPYNRVEFIYGETRSEKIEAIYKANIQTPETKYLIARVTKYLTGIMCYTINDEIYREYEIQYAASGVLGKKHIEKIYEKVSDEVFYNPLKFDWDLEEAGYSVNQTEMYGSFKDDTPNIVITPGDFNGDGKTDILNVWLDDDDIYKLRISYNTGSENGFTSKVIRNLESCPENIYIIDFDGNGFSDIIIKYTYNNYKYYYADKNGNDIIIGPFPIFDFIPVEADKTNFYAGDFNGDGINDGLLEILYEGYYDDYDAIFKIIWGQTNGVPINYFTSGTFISQKFTCVADFDGDGKSEIFGQSEDYIGLSYLLDIENEQFNFIQISYNLSGVHTKLQFGDFNGDKKTDILKLDESSNWTIYQSAGNHFKEGISITKEDISEDKVYPGDFNGDGRIDFMVSPDYFNGGSWSGVKLWLANTEGKNFALVNLTIDENPIIHTDTRLFIGDFDGNGRTDFISCEGDNADPDYYFYGIYGNNNNLITSITNGLGDVFEINYDPITKYYVYSPEIPLNKCKDNTDYPISNFIGSLYVVEQVYHNTNSGYTAIRYRYYAAKTHRYGKGFLGFMMTEQEDLTNFVKIRQYYDYDETFYNVYNKGSSVKISVYPNTTISVTESTIDFNINSINPKIFFPYSNFTYNRTFELDGNFIKSSKTESQYDSYGNLTYLKTYNGNVNFSSGIPPDSYFDNSFREEVWNVYKPADETNWILGRLETATVTNHVPDQDVQDITRSSEFEYYNNGTLWKETFQPGNTKSVTKEYFYDNYGNISKTIHHAQGMDDRIFETYYDTDLPELQKKGRFLTLSTNGMGHQESKIYDQIKGLVTEITDLNSLAIHFEYDDFGNLIKTIDPTDFESVSVYRWVDAEDNDKPTGAVFFNWSRKSGSTEFKTYFDSQGKKLREVKVGFNGTKIYIDNAYDYHQYLTSVSEPYFINTLPENINYITYTYDALGRQKTITVPGERITIINYKGLTTETINPNLQMTKKVVNELGWIVRNYDATEQNNVEFKYFSDGSVWKKYISNHPETEIVKTYDIFGNCEHVTDPALGIIDYEYNAFGEVTKKTKNGIIISNNITYDVLGRLISHDEPADNRKNFFYYDTEANGIGKIDYEEVKNASGILIHRVSYNYDNFGRVEDKTERVNVDGQEEDLITSYQYDIFSRLIKLIYPSGFSTTSKYNQYGYLGKIIRDTDNKTVWQVTQMNARQQIETMLLGNGLTTINEYDPWTGYLESIKTNKLGIAIQDETYSWDAIGNLLVRSKFSQEGNYLQEDFQYDILNRLKQIDVDYYTGMATIEIDYDALGRILYKKSTNPLFHTANNYIYEGDGDNNPYNLWQIDDVPALYTVNGLQQELTFTKFDKLSHITQGNKQLDLIYGLGHSRIIQKISYPGHNQTKIYIGGIYEKIIENGVTREVHYLAVGSGVFAIFTKNTNGPNEFVYAHLDHLGSIEALTDETGLLVEEYSYDAWGLRRNPNNWMPFESTQILQTNRGFTGHDHLDLFALVNMNGRVYDPVIGYFISPDPFSQFPGYTQGFNRYSYCINNPLSFTDPSGYFSCPSINFSTDEIIQGITYVGVTAMAIIITIETAGLGSGIGYTMLAGAVGGFTGGYTMAMVNGASFNDCLAAGLQGAVAGAISAGLSAGIGSEFGAGLDNIHQVTWSQLENEIGRSLAHGVVQGGLRALQGGRFEQGFFAGAISSLSGSFTNTKLGFPSYASVAIGATLGGTAEALGGGKFANGAITGAFVVLFNHLQHNTGEPTESDGGYVLSKKEGLYFIRAKAIELNVEVSLWELEDGSYFVEPWCDSTEGKSPQGGDGWWEPRSDGQYFDGLRIISEYHYAPSDPGKTSVSGWGDVMFAYRNNINVYHISSQSVYFSPAGTAAIWNYANYGNSVPIINSSSNYINGNYIPLRHRY